MAISTTGKLALTEDTAVQKRRTHLRAGSVDKSSAVQYVASVGTFLLRNERRDLMIR